MILDFETEFSAGLHDSEIDISKHGIDYAQYLMQGQDKNDPYIKGYMEYLNDYIAKYCNNL